MRNVLGTEAARWLAGHHRDNGVELVSETRVTGFDGNGSGLTVSDGVVCDERLFASGAQDVVAAGDVARWPHNLYGGTLVRIEHWSNANDQGAAAALNLPAGPENAKPFADLPSFATHVHGARIQTAGLPHLADESRIVTGDPGEGRFAVAFARDGALVGAAAVNAPKDLIRIKRAIAAGDRLSSLA
jgi:NADPH-dependent 2,4-dienoyl-CoA reductase/sulfur reductase-like enzyme